MSNFPAQPCIQDRGDEFSAILQNEDYENRDDLAKEDGDIPVGAMIYSGPDYSSGTICEICGKDPGHVAIYMGDGKVEGSQSQYIMTFDEFRVIFGYGGWSFSGNVYE